MSISTMTNLAIQRRRDATDETPPAKSYQAIAAAGGGGPVSDTNITAALKTIVSYIPTEVVTLYVALAAAAPPIPPATAELVVEWQLRLFLLFLLATPAAVWVVFAVKVKAGGGATPTGPSTWPKWEMFAGTIAYAAWAAALPQNPLAFLGYSQRVAGVMVLVVASTIGLVAPLFQTPLPAK